MFDPHQLEKMLFFDIETAGSVNHADSLSTKMQELWSTKSDLLRNQLGAKYPDNKDKSDEDLFQMKAALHAEFGRVVCVSFGIWDNGEHRMTSFYGEDEKEILEKTNKVLANASAKGMKICGHNIKIFDVPFLGKKMIFNGMTPPPNLQLWDKKPWEVPILDTSEFFSFGSWSHKFLGLDLLACSLGIDSPKEDIDGSQVHGTFWVEKAYDRIKEYCERDVITVMDVLQKVSR